MATKKHPYKLILVTWCQYNKSTSNTFVLLLRSNQRAGNSSLYVHMPRSGRQVCLNNQVGSNMPVF